MHDTTNQGRPNSKLQGGGKKFQARAKRARFFFCPPLRDFCPPLRAPQGGAKNAQRGAKTILFLKINKFDNKKIFILSVLMMYDDT